LLFNSLDSILEPVTAILVYGGGDYGHTRQTQYQEAQAEHIKEARGEKARGKEIH
jgi:hypothetical protein